MILSYRSRATRLFIGLILLVAAGPALSQSLADATLDVFKDENCGCCVGWIDNMQEAGFASKINHPRDLNGVKEGLGVLPKWQSCHTAVTKGGYVFEGHIPAKYIEQFLASPPEGALGLAVPGMPLGSPGMEMEGRFRPYNIYLLKKDGSTEVYASVESADQQ